MTSKERKDKYHVVEYKGELKKLECQWSNSDIYYYADMEVLKSFNSKEDRDFYYDTTAELRPI